MKILQAIIVIFAVVGCLALALGGYIVYNMSTKGGDNLLTKIRAVRSEVPAGVVTTAPATAAPAPKSEYAKIIQQYQPTPTPTPVAAAPQTGGAVAPAYQAATIASAPVAKQQPPIHTPKPDEGKIRSWPSGRKWVALTYDDGPHPEWTPKMIELLRSKDVKATFFLLGQEIKRFPEIAKSIHDNGFEIGNHTMNHPDFNKSSMTPDAIRKQLQETNDLIAEYATQQPVQIMRPPFGNTPKKLVDICQEMHLNIVCWNIDTDDWRSKTETKDMVDNIMKNLSDGSIILMHDKHQKTYDTTAEVIDKIREKGYEFVTVGELLGIQPYKQGGPVEIAARTGGVPAQPAAAPPQPATAPAQPAAAPAAAASPTPASVPGARGLPPADLGDSGAGSLPAPSAATPVPGIDESKITQPPPR